MTPAFSVSFYSNVEVHNLYTSSNLFIVFWYGKYTLMNWAVNGLLLFNIVKTISMGMVFIGLLVINNLKTCYIIMYVTCRLKKTWVLLWRNRNSCFYSVVNRWWTWEVNVSTTLTQWGRWTRNASNVLGEFTSYHYCIYIGICQYCYFYVYD